MADSCAQYVSTDDLKAAKESILHIEHVATSKDANGNPALVVTDPIRGVGYTNATLDGLFSDIGFKPVNGSFEDGGTLVNRWDVLLYETNGAFYQWAGTIPVGGLVVPAGSSPFDSGGNLLPGWVDQTDLTLRSQLKNKDGESLVGGATYAQIRASNVTGDQIKCLGRAANRDGGEGWFFLDAADTTTADDDGTVLVDSVGRRWKRAFDGSKKAAWFGVKYGVDAATAIQAAVNTGGKIEVKDGQYPINTRVNIDTTGTTFPSLGRDSKRVSFSGESAHGTTFKPLGNFIRMVCSSSSAFGQGQLNWTTFRDFCVFPDTAGNPVGTALDFVDGISNSIDNVIIRRMDLGVSMVGMLSGSVRNSEIDRNRIGVYLDAGPTLGNINNYNFSGNQISLNAEFAVKGTVGTRVVFENGGFEQNGQGLDGSGGTESTGCIDIAIAEPMGVVTFSNLYFEGNEGLADIIIRNATPTGTPVIVNIMNCKFGRGNSRGKGTKYVLQTFSPGGAPIIVNFFGCQFFMQKSFGYDPGVDGWYINNRPYLYCRGLDSCYYSHPEYINPSLHTQSYATGISVAADGTALIAPNGVTITKTGTGAYRLVSTYGWGTSVDMYQVVGTTPSSGNTILHVNKVTSTTFDVIVQGTGGGAVDSKFDLIITKPHSRYGT